MMQWVEALNISSACDTCLLCGGKYIPAALSPTGANINDKKNINTPVLPSDYCSAKCMVCIYVHICIYLFIVALCACIVSL